MTTKKVSVKEYASLPVEKRIELHARQPILNWWNATVKANLKKDALTLVEIAALTPGNSIGSVRLAFEHKRIAGSIGFAKSNLKEWVIERPEAKKFLENRGLTIALDKAEYTASELAKLAGIDTRTVLYHRGDKYVATQRDCEKGKHTWIAQAEEAKKYIERSNRILKMKPSLSVLNQQLSDLGIKLSYPSFRKLADAEGIVRGGVNGERKGIDFSEIMRLSVKMRNMSTNYTPLSDIFPPGTPCYALALAKLAKGAISGTKVWNRWYVAKELASRIEREKDELLIISDAIEYLNGQGRRMDASVFYTNLKRNRIRTRLNWKGQMSLTRQELYDIFIWPEKAKRISAEMLSLKEGSRAHRSFMAKSLEEANTMSILFRNFGITVPSITLVEMDVKRLKATLERIYGKEQDLDVEREQRMALLASVNITKENIYYGVLINLKLERIKKSINAIRAFGVSDMKYLGNYFMYKPESLSRQKLLNRYNRTKAHAEIPDQYVSGMLVSEMTLQNKVARSFVKRRIESFPFTKEQKERRIKALLSRGYTEERISFYSKKPISYIREVASKEVAVLNGGSLLTNGAAALQRQGTKVFGGSGTVQPSKEDNQSLPKDHVEVLFRALELGDRTAFKEIYEAHLFLVPDLIRKKGYRDQMFLDLVQEGYLDLRAAIFKYDWRKAKSASGSFRGFAQQRISWMIARKVHSLYSVVDVPTHELQKREKLKKGVQKLIREEKEASVENLSAETGFSEGVVKTAMERSLFTVSLDEPVNEDGEQTMLDSISGADGEEDLVERDDRDIAGKMVHAVKSSKLFKERDKSIWLRIRVEDPENKQLVEQIANEYDLSKQRVGQIVKEIDSQLRKKFTKLMRPEAE